MSHFVSVRSLPKYLIAWVPFVGAISVVHAAFYLIQDVDWSVLGSDVEGLWQSSVFALCVCAIQLTLTALPVILIAAIYKAFYRRPVSDRTWAHIRSWPVTASFAPLLLTLGAVSGIEEREGIFWWGFGLVVAVAILFVMHVGVRIGRSRATAPFHPDNTIEDDDTAIVAYLRERAWHSRWNGHFLIALFLAVACSGVALFLFSGRIIQRPFDNIAMRPIDAIEQTMRDLTHAAQNAMAVSNRVTELHSPGIISASPPKDIEAAAVALENEVFRLRSTVDSTIEQIRADLEEAETAIIAGLDEHQNQAGSVVNDILTRTTCVVITLILLQAIVTLYRYSMRVAENYEGRANALAVAHAMDPETARKFFDADVIGFASPKQATGFTMPEILEAMAKVHGFANTEMRAGKAKTDAASASTDSSDGSPL